jgi:preprotein translocase subunit YajC
MNNSGLVSSLVPFIIMLAVFYLIIFVPEGRRKKKFKSMLDALKLNDEIITRGGILGKVVNIQDNAITVQTGPDRIKIKIEKNAVLKVLNEKLEGAIVAPKVK